ncbi:ORF6N domain-containing protein [Candidatus Margulisiibacteriota bacterium]
MDKNYLIEPEIIQTKIYYLRGKKVMLDEDLALLYDVATGNLNKAVRRNKSRFPQDFCFQLNKEEYEVLRFQIGISKTGKGGRRYLPLVFTEQGIAMLSSVLNSERAIKVNIQIMRTFVKLRELLTGHKELRQKIEEMEQKYDQQFRIVFEAIRELLVNPEQPKKIGFVRDKDKNN